MLNLDQIQARFDAALARHIRVEEGPVGVAVSGGSDSLALLRLAHRWSLETGTGLIAFTVDHGLRPEAASEAAHVAGICKRLSVTHQTLRWQNPKGTQAAARRGRHALLAEALRAAGGRFLLTGHTQGDQAETFLIRARAGSGWYGLAGMTEIAVSPVWPEGRGIQIVRPVLEASRNDLRKLVSEAGWDWINDPSNQDMKYERVRVRALLTENEVLRNRVQNSQMRLRALRSNSDHILAAWLMGHVSADPHGLVTANMRALQPSLYSRALSLIIQAASGSDRSPNGDGLLSLAETIRTGAPMLGQTLGGAWLRKKDGKLRIARDPGMAGKVGSFGNIWDGRFVIDETRPPVEAAEAPAMARAGLPTGAGIKACLVGARLIAFADALGGPQFADKKTCQERESFFRVKAPMYD